MKKCLSSLLLILCIIATSAIAVDGGSYIPTFPTSQGLTGFLTSGAAMDFLNTLTVKESQLGAKGDPIFVEYTAPGINALSGLNFTAFEADSNGILYNQYATGNVLSLATSGTTNIYGGEIGAVANVTGGERIPLEFQVYQQSDRVNPVHPTFADLGNGQYEPEIIKGELIIKDGKIYISIDGELPKDALVGLTKLGDRNLKAWDQALMFITGKGPDGFNVDGFVHELDPNGNSDDPDDPDDPEDDINKSIDEGYRYTVRAVSTTPYVDMNPNPSANISSSQYDVSRGIPTSENLKYSLSTKDALHQITTRRYDVDAGVRNIQIRVTADYPVYTYGRKRNGEIDYDNIIDTDIKTVTVTDTFSYSYRGQKEFHDVPVSNIYPVTSGMVSASKDGNVLSAYIPLSGASGPGAQELVVLTRLPQVEPIVRDFAGTFRSRAEAESYAYTKLREKKEEIVNEVQDCIWQVGTVNYSYKGLSVTTFSCSGTPQPGQTGGESINMIPSTYPNGTYKGSGLVSYRWF